MTIDQSRSLVLQMQQGDAAAYERLLTEFGPRLLATARRMCGNDADAQDVLQDACVACFKNIGTFKNESSIYTWMHRIVVTAALMKLRKKKRRGEASIEPMLPAFREDGHRLPDQGEKAWCESAHELAARGEMRKVVHTCIDQLPESYRNVLLLRDIEEFDTTQTAEALGVNEGVVKTRLHRARQALRTLLVPYVAAKELTAP
jgi:RNA polymerase sigma-70 factor (ECF subfamily)